MIPTLASAALTVSRSFELAILVKATAILAIGVAAAQMMRRTQASIRHLTLAAAFATVMALPLVTVAGPKVAIGLPIDERPALDAAAVQGPVPVGAGSVPMGTGPRAGSSQWSASLSVPAILRAIWILGAASLLAALATGLWRLRRLRRQALPLPEIQRLANRLAREAGIRRHVDVLEHERVPTPLTCGVWRPAILLPADVHDWTDPNLRRALVHEIEHVRRGDWALQIGVTVVAALYWFHPLVWIASRRLRLEAERACDDAVVRSGDGTDYADQLVVLARRMSPGNPAAIVGMAVRTDLSARVTALLDATQRRGRPGVAAGVAATLAAAVVVMGVAPIRAVAFNPALRLHSGQALRLRSGQGVSEPLRLRAGPAGAQRRSGERRVRGLDRALYEASEDGDLAEIDDLLHQGANVNTTIDGDGSPLIAAARRARVWAQQGSRPQDGEWRTPLSVARRGRHVAVIEFLVSAGAQ